MALKSERLELRLPQETLERLDRWRSLEADVPSRSEAARRLLEDGLAQHRREGFRPTDGEKLTTWLLTEILKNQLAAKKDGEKAHRLRELDVIQEALYGGHFWALSWELPGVLHDHQDSPTAVRQVVDILDMWSFIEEAYEEFSDDDKERIAKEVGPLGRNPKFHGFDGNNEAEYLGIARFLVEKMGRFERFRGRDFNSHVPTVDRYARMASVFEDIRKTLIGRGLTPHQLIEMLKLK